MNRYVLKVEGMSCEGCVRTVRKTIEKYGGKEVEVSLDEQKATFMLENGNVERIVDAINKIGYRAELLEK